MHISSAFLDPQNNMRYTHNVSLGLERRELPLDVGGLSWQDLPHGIEALQDGVREVLLMHIITLHHN